MSPRGKVQNEQMRFETLDKIEKGAIKTFASYGFYGATMKKLAADTGLSYGLLYHYFKSKEEVFSHVVSVALDNTDKTFKAIGEFEGTPWEKVMNMSRVMIRESFTGESSLYFHIVLQAVTQENNIDGLKESIIGKSKAVFDIIIPIIVEGQEAGVVTDGNPIALAIAYISMIQGLAVFAVGQGGIQTLITPEVLSNLLKK